MRGKNKRQKTNYNETQFKKKQKQIQTGESKPELTEIQIIENHKVPLSTKNPITIQQHLDLELKYLKTQIKEKESDGVRLKNENNTDRKPKKKIALLFSYCGTGYQGMQINPMVPTIELDLLKALALSGAVSEDNSMKPNKIGFVRCARTDKGVHAGGQVVSFKMILEQDIIEKINNYLPPQIRVWGYARVNNSFSAHTLCDSRIYEYLLPTYCFMEASAIDYPFSNVAIETDMTLEKSGRTLFQPREVIEPTLEEMQLKRQYRITNQKLDQFNSILSKYVGTHNYHNFTVGKSFNDRSAQRYITLCEAGVPFLQDGAEWLSIKIHGQSFMLHQIRKMMGLGIMLMRTNSPLTIFETVFGQERINIPKAPPIGLLLERPIFAKYNENVGVKEDKHEINFDQYKDDINAFKTEWIYKTIHEDETKENHFEQWMRLVDSCSDDYGWYLTPEGKNVDIKPPTLFQKGVVSSEILPPGDDGEE